MSCLQNHPHKIYNNKNFPKKSGKIINNIITNNSLQKKTTNNFIYKLEIISDREPPESFVGSQQNSFLEHLDKRIYLY
jgi:hypothetical protein